MAADRDVLALFGAAKAEGMKVDTYAAPGPVGHAYLTDRVNKVRFIMGPIGSGKTSLNFFDKLTLAGQMPKCTRGPYAGHRLFRHVEVRDTYANLWETTIKSWWSWFGPDVGEWTGGVGRRASHKLTFGTPDDGLIHFEMIFQAIQDQDVDAALRGLEATTANMGEADRQPPEVLPYLIGRVLQQRFPPKRFFEPGTEYHACVTGDQNPPDTDSWNYRLFEEQRPEGYRLYKQPSGRGPHGENRAYISRERYEELAELNKHRPDYVKRMVDGEYAASRDGEPVYGEYDDSTHYAERELAAVPGLKLRLGFDQGIRGPAMVVTQWMPDGQLRILDEYYPGRIGPTGFGRGCKLLLAQRYRGYEIERATGDPAGFFGGDNETGDKAMFDVVAEQLGIPIFPAESNEIAIRQDGVRQLLRYRIDGRKPGVLVSNRCPMVRKGFNSHYRFKKRAGLDGVVDTRPEKNEYCDVHDALQYGVMDLVGLVGIKRGELMGGRGDRIGQPGGGGWDDDDDHGGSVMAKTDFDVWAT